MPEPRAESLFTEQSREGARTGEDRNEVRGRESEEKNRRGKERREANEVRAGERWGALAAACAVALHTHWLASERERRTVSAQVWACFDHEWAAGRPTTHSGTRGQLEGHSRDGCCEGTRRGREERRTRARVPQEEFVQLVLERDGVQTGAPLHQQARVHTETRSDAV